MVRTRPSFIDYGLDIRDKLRGEHADVASLLLERRLAFPARAVCCYAAFTAAVATATVVSRISGKDWVTHDLGSIASVPITDRSLFLNRATQLFLFLAFVMGGIQGCALVLSLPRMTEARRSVEAVSATQSPTERLQSLLRTYEALAVKESRFAALIVGVLCLHGAVAHLGLAMDWFPLFFHQGDTSNPVSNYCLGATDAAAWAICLSCTWPRVPTSAVVCTPLVIYANYSLINVLSVWQSQVLALTSAVVVLTAVTYAIFLTQGAVRQLRWTGKGGGSSDPPGRMVRAFTNRPNGPCRRAPSDGLNAAADVEHGQPVPTGTSFSATSISSSSTATAASSVPVPVHRGRARARVCRLCCCCRPSPRHQEAPDTRPPSMSPINPVQAMTNKSEADDALFSDVAHSHLAAARRLRLLGAAGMISLTVFSVLHFLIFLASQFMDSFGVLVLLHAFIVLGFLLKGIALPILLVQFVLLVRQRLTASLHNAGREAEARHRIQQQRGFLRYGAAPPAPYASPHPTLIPPPHSVPRSPRAAQHHLHGHRRDRRDAAGPAGICAGELRGLHRHHHRGPTGPPQPCSRLRAGGGLRGTVPFAQRAHSRAVAGHAG